MTAQARSRRIRARTVVIWTHALAVPTGAATPTGLNQKAGSAGLHWRRADPNKHRTICCDLFALAGRSSVELAMEGCSCCGGQVCDADR